MNSAFRRFVTGMSTPEMFVSGRDFSRALYRQTGIAASAAARAGRTRVSDPYEHMSIPQRNITAQEADALEHAPGRERENLEGWIPRLASDEEIRAAFEKAFDYRGDVSITLKTGEKIEGYIFDRRTGMSLTDSLVRLYPKTGNEKISILYVDIAALAFTGKDTAAGKSWEAWMKKYNEKKAAGEKNIGLQPEALE